MSLSMSDAERITLNRLVPLLRAEGYEVIPDPGPEDLPPFLGEWHPDAIAIGKRPSLIVEVFRKEGGRELKKVHELRSLLADQDDWDLRVFYFSSLEPVLYPVADVTTTEAIRAARNVAAIEPRAAMLFAWSILEAVARDRIETVGTRPLNPSALVNLLTGEGYVEQSQANRMFELAKVRSQVAHGQLDFAASTEDVLWVLSVSEELVKD